VNESTKRDRLDRVQLGACLNCRYSLKGLSESKCPECGHRFDPHDPASMYIGRIPGAVGSFVLSAPSWPMLSATSVAALLTLLTSASPGGWLIGIIILAMAWPVLGAIWLWRAVARVVAGIYFSRCRLRVREVAGWLTAPVIVMAVIVLLIVRAPMRVAFWCSRSAMDQLAAEVLAQPQRKFVGRQVGLYSASLVRTIPGGMSFETGSSGFLTSSGFAYLPQGPSIASAAQYEHFSGPWYTYYEDFD
jgi:hypothetical protein